MFKKTVDFRMYDGNRVSFDMRLCSKARSLASAACHRLQQL